MNGCFHELPLNWPFMVLPCTIALSETIDVNGNLIYPWSTGQHQTDGRPAEYRLYHLFQSLPWLFTHYEESRLQLVDR